MINRDVFFSIIVPVYEAEKFIKKCIDSVLFQSFKAFEVICINDGSTDNSGLILEEYARKDARIRVIHTKNNGIAASRNTGLDIAGGDWLYFMDADDWIEPELLSKLHKYITLNDIEIVVFDFYINNDKKQISKTIFPHQNNLCFESFPKTEVLLEYMKATQAVWNKFFSRKFIEDNNIRFIDLYHADDVLFSMESFAKSNKIGYLRYYGYHYVENKSSITHRFSDKQSEMRINLYYKEMQLSKYFDDIQYVQYINSQLINSLMVIGYRYVFHPDNQLDPHKRVQELKCILKKAPFSEAVNNYHRSYLSKSSKLIMLFNRPNITILHILSYIKQWN